MKIGNETLYESLLIRGTDDKKRSLTITWLGTAGIHIYDGRHGILIDPYASRFPLSHIMLGKPLPPDEDAVENVLKRIGTVSAVAVSHSHFDHLVDAPLFALRSGADLIGSTSTAVVARVGGIPDKKILTCEHGTTVSCGGFTLRFIESLHGTSLLGSLLLDGEIGDDFCSPAPCTRYKKGAVFSIMITHRYGTIVHHGSAGAVPGMYRDLGCDILLHGIAQRGNTDRYLEQTAVPLCPRLVIPIHFDNFFKRSFDRISFLPRIRLNEYVESIRRTVPSATVCTLPPGAAVRIRC